MLSKEQPMTRVNDADPIPSDATQKPDEFEQQEMKRVEEEAAQDRATEGGHQ